MKYEIQCKIKSTMKGWHSFASADELVVAETILRHYEEKNKGAKSFIGEYQYRIYDAQSNTLIG